MAENQDGQERTEEASAKKLADARKKGQVPRSKELATMAVTMMGAAMLIVTGGSLATGMQDIMRQTLSPNYLLASSDRMAGQLYEMLVRGLLTIWPLMLAAFIAAIAANTVLGGWTFKLSFKPERLDPIKGVGKLFSVRSLGELFKSIVKMLFIGAAAYAVLEVMSTDILNLGMQDPR
ncbi:MAG: EscU/YscU/HrcU family type III secretion system export apparatus switch protein, partial [Spongiibacter sp.]